MMDENTRKALELLEEAINSGEFEEFFKDEQRIIDYLDNKVKRMMDGLVITPVVEEKVVKWFAKRKRVFYKNPNLWYGFLKIVIEEGILRIEGKFEEPNLFLVNSILWRNYTFRQYWTENDTLVIIYKENKEILRM